MLSNLPPGVTEIYIHPAQEGEQLKQIIRHKWEIRIEEYRLFLDDPGIRRTLREHHIIMIGYRELFRLQRGLR